MPQDDDVLEARRAEFDEFIWIHTDDAFQQAFDTATDIPEAVRDELVALVRDAAEGADEDELAESIREAVGRAGTDLLLKLIQVVGLTRSKLLGDVKAMGIGVGVAAKAPGSCELLPKRREHWELASRELAARLRAVFSPLSASDDETVADAVEVANRATWPGYIRQERAKRSGHQAEARLARICAALDIPFEPKIKAEQDIAPDVTLADTSFDLVFPSVAAPRACVIATVHTANIGQFGESKDKGDIDLAKRALATLTPRPKLIALADGLGFHSNIAGLNGVLMAADEFCQFRTLWKGAVVAAASSHLSVGLWLPDIEPFGEFLTRYSETVELLADKPDDGVQAGDGYLVRL